MAAGVGIVVEGTRLPEPLHARIAGAIHALRYLCYAGCAAHCYAVNSAAERARSHVTEYAALLLPLVRLLPLEGALRVKAASAVRARMRRVVSLVGALQRYVAVPECAACSANQCCIGCGLPYATAAHMPLQLPRF